MRNFRSIVVAGLGVLLFTLGQSQTAAAQEGPSRYIETTGKSTIYVDPDQAVVTFGVRIPRSELDQAIDEANTRVERILLAIRELGIDDSNIATSTFRINRRTDRRRQSDGADKVNEYFEVVRTFTVTTTPDEAAAVIDTAFKQGANMLTGVQFGVKATREIADRARNQALVAAREKAAAMAAALGSQIGQPLRIEEMQSLPWRNPASNTLAFEAGRQGGTELPSGEVAITAEVRVRFAIN